MEQISQEQVKHMAQLSRLELTESELDLYTKQMAEILDYASHLPELPKTETGSGPQMRVADDEARQTEEPAALLQNALAVDNGFVKVPAILDKSES